MNFLKSKFLLILFVNLVFALVFVTTAFSFGYEGKLSWTTIGTSLQTLFGGITSLLSIIGAVAFIVVVFALVRYYADRNKDVAGGIAVFGLILAGFAWQAFVRLPDGRGWQLLALLVFVTAQTLVVCGKMSTWSKRAKVSMARRQARRLSDADATPPVPTPPTI